MSLSEQNRALIERVTGINPWGNSWYDAFADLFGRLLDAARAEGVAALQQAGRREARKDIERLHYAGVRASIAWLHAHAETMNDPHAKAVINTAAYGLGVNKPPPALQQAGEPVAWRVRIGVSNMWGYCETERDADFYGKQGGLNYIKEPLYASSPIRQQGGGK